MATPEMAAAAAALEAAAASMLQNVPGTPPSETDGGSLSAAAVGAAPSAPSAPPSLADLLQHLMAQNDRMSNMMEMMQYDRKNGATNANDKSHLANVRLDE